MNMIAQMASGCGYAEGLVFALPVEMSRQRGLILMEGHSKWLFQRTITASLQSSFCLSILYKSCVRNADMLFLNTCDALRPPLLAF